MGRGAGAVRARAAIRLRIGRDGTGRHLPAAVAWRQRIRDAADAGCGHQGERDLGGSLHAPAPGCPAPAQYEIAAALSAPAATEANPSEIAGARSPAAMRCGRLGIGMRTTKYTMTCTIRAITLQIAQSMR